MNHWLPKRLISQWIDQKTLAGSETLYPKECMVFVQKHCPMTEKEIFDYLFQFVLEGQLYAKAYLICEHKEQRMYPPTTLHEETSCIYNGQVMINLNRILGQPFSCPDCGTMIWGNAENIFILFSPTEEYRTYLKKEKKPIIEEPRIS